MLCCDVLSLLYRISIAPLLSDLEGHQFATGETIYLSIALRRRSSLSDEPTNLYVKNLPSSWSNDKLRKVFGAYGQIRQSKVVGDGIAFVRFEDHEQALNAIGRLDKQMVEQGCKLEVRFATRKTAANAYRLQQVPQSKSNENNLYIRNLPKNFTQSSLEQLFVAFGKISSAKINDNGIAFVRYDIHSLSLCFVLFWCSLNRDFVRKCDSVSYSVLPRSLILLTIFVVEIEQVRARRGRQAGDSRVEREASAQFRGGDCGETGAF